MGNLMNSESKIIDMANKKKKVFDQCASMHFKLSDEYKLLSNIEDAILHASSPPFIIYSITKHLRTHYAFGGVLVSTCLSVAKVIGYAYFLIGVHQSAKLFLLSAFYIISARQ